METMSIEYILALLIAFLQRTGFIYVVFAYLAIKGVTLLLETLSTFRSK